MLGALHGRYRRANRRENGQLLDEVVALTGNRRKHAVRLLRERRRPQYWAAASAACGCMGRTMAALRAAAEACWFHQTYRNAAGSVVR